MKQFDMLDDCFRELFNLYKSITYDSNTHSEDYDIDRIVENELHKTV